MKAVFQLNNLTKARKYSVILALVFSIMPALIVISLIIINDLQDSLLGVITLLVSWPVVPISILVYLIADTNLKRKIIVIFAMILVQILLLPAIWGINDIKLHLFVNKNQKELAFISDNLIEDKWTFEQAKEYLKTKQIPIKLELYNREEKEVLFLISGILDNCNGIAYTKTGKKISTNNCGRMVLWEKINENWYKWATT